MGTKPIVLTTAVLVLSLTAGAHADSHVGYWNFDAGSGDTVADSSGNGYDGTISGATWHEGGWDGTGWCLDFDGSDDLVEVGVVDVVGSGISLAAWIRPDNFDIDDGRMTTKANEWDEDAHWWMLSTISDAGQIKLRFRLKTTDGAPTTTLIAGSGPLATDEWQHTAAIWDASTMLLYLNAEEVGSAGKGGDAVATDDTVKASIGSQPSNAFTTDPSHINKFFDGLIDEVLLYSRAMSQDQLRDLMDGILPAWTEASDPVPENGSIHEGTWANVTWRAGDYAVSHDIYFGEDFDDVNGATPDSDTYRGNTTEEWFLVGFPRYRYPTGLLAGTTYYWRIDEVNDANDESPWKGDVWSFWLPTKKAYGPYPADGMNFVDPNADLSWSAGWNAAMHFVHFGDDYDTVLNATGGTPQATTTIAQHFIASHPIRLLAPFTHPQATFFSRRKRALGASCSVKNLQQFLAPLSRL